MLYISEFARRAYLTVEIKRKPLALNKDRRRNLIAKVAAILKTGEPTVFALEATCRHGVRARLCLEGWGWQLADITAADIVSAALRKIGAQRPAWAEGQPEHLQNFSGAMIARTRCVRCHKPLPDGHWKFCGATCSTVHFRALQEIQMADEGEAYDRVAQSARKHQW